MTADHVLEYRPLVLDQRARERYFAEGFLTVPGYVGAAWLHRLRAVVAAKIEESRALTASDDQFDLAPDHSAEKPNIRRLRKAVDQHPELWAFAQDPTIVDLVADLLGPDVRFHSSKLNFKWSDGGDPVRWHQDIQAWPHTGVSSAVMVSGRSPSTTKTMTNRLPIGSPTPPASGPSSASGSSPPEARAAYAGRAGASQGTVPMSAGTQTSRISRASEVRISL
jgi:hypothetical protein